MGAAVPEMQLMVDALFVKQAAEVAGVIEERVGLADGQNDIDLAQLIQAPGAGQAGPGRKCVGVWK
jgi:hypothetical protein